MNTKLIGGVAVAGLIVGLIALFRSPATLPTQNGDALDTILKNKKMSVCYVVWPPSITKDPDSGELSGFLVDLTNGISQDAGLTPDFVESSWGGFPADLASGKCDVGVAGFYPLINRSTAVAFTRPFYYAGNNGVVRANDNRFRLLSDLNQSNVKIAVLQGEYGQIYAQKYLPQAELVVLPQTADNTAPLVAVSSGQADVGLIVADVVSDYAKTHPEVKKLFDAPYSTSPITWAVRPGDQKLLNFMNNAINYMEASGELNALAGQYSSTWYTIKRDYQLN